MRNLGKILVTTPIFYTNASPHIGHLYTMLYSDAYARWLKQKDPLTKFTTGTDEHGLKIFQAAQQSKTSPQSFVDLQSQKFKILAQTYNIEYDYFSRTSDPSHKNYVKEAWKQLYAEKKIQKHKYRGYYCQVEESFIQERDIIVQEGQPPVNYFFLKFIFQMSKMGNELIITDEENYALDFSKLETQLSQLIFSQSIKINPQYHHQILDSIKDLKMLSISRLKDKVPCVKEGQMGYRSAK